ncbi:NADH:ubiquinone oxidoreductase [candidate division KSB3 bacterium]|uniref:NADH:ubiquinone oxidoreductase n=1 Tax=candidate division KSB3 bacterium TaxID=2044937 RepID=A0A2G6EAG7_9BACT|nr:MAG: NADH:ubiquinone oxidoreductase [candidate division KSB3 bacterium]PIE30773.1 MAG: NADH:ubiquinone oxidoreductase [candidate division KSB3 bacterium]
MIQLTIDGRQIAVDANTTILEAAKQLNIYIPTLCHLNLKELNVSNRTASCRICVVEVEGRRNLAPACATPVAEGMTVRTNSIRVLRSRRKVLDLFLSDHPFDCLNCSKSTDCELQTLASNFGIDTKPYDDGAKSTYEIDTSSGALKRDLNKCVMCRRCETICNDVQTVSVLTGFGRGFEAVVAPAEMKALDKSICTFCGQCVSVCPTAALTSIEYSRDVWRAIFDEGKTVIVQTAPAIRAAIGELFGLEGGVPVTGKLVAGLRRLGFDGVFDTNFGADLTIMEEANELVQRLESGQDLPLLTSCCPGWINFLEFQFPDLLNIPSSCKSPQQMFGSIAKTYYAEKIGVKAKDLVVVAIMPCLAKKYEAARPEHRVNGVRDVDYVLTTRELGKMFKEAGIDMRHLEEEEYDSPLGESTGAADIFGVTGGVLEAALRTAYERVTGQELENVDFSDVRGMKGIKEAQIDLNGKILNVAVTSGLGNARKILEKVEDGTSKYDVIEIMACPGGCINGGGQPYIHGDTSKLEARMKAIYSEDSRKTHRKSHENESIKKLYDEFLGEPGSHRAHEILHTTYFSQKHYPGN